MCLICAEIFKGNLTSREAKRNLSEIVQSKELPPEHLEDVQKHIDQLELLEKVGLR